MKTKDQEKVMIRGSRKDNGPLCVFDFEAKPTNIHGNRKLTHVGNVLQNVTSIKDGKVGYQAKIDGKYAWITIPTVYTKNLLPV